MKPVTERGAQFQPIYDTKLAVALMALGVDMHEPVMTPASQHPSGKDGWVFFFDPNQKLAEIEPNGGDLTAGDARKKYEDFQYCKFHPEALTSILRFALESYQRTNKFFRSGNALVHTLVPQGRAVVDGANVFRAEGLMTRQNYGDGDLLVRVKLGRSWYLVRKSQRNATLKG